MRNKLFFLVILFGISGCSESDATGTYFMGDHSAAVKVEFTETNDGKLSGSISVAKIDYSTDRVEVFTKPLSGINSNGSISVIVQSNAWGGDAAPVDFTLHGSELEMKGAGKSPSLALVKGQHSDYVSKVNELEKLMLANGNENFEFD